MLNWLLREGEIDRANQQIAATRNLEERPLVDNSIRAADLSEHRLKVAS